MFLGMGPMELLIILGIALLIFGPKNLPKLGKSLGETVKNVREGMEGDEPAKVEEKTTASAPAPVAEPEPAAEEPEVEIDEEVVFCSKCGAKNKVGDAFCSKCGNKLAA